MFFRGREAVLERTERTAWQRAIVQAFHTERFARVKRLGQAELEKTLAPYQKAVKRAQTQVQLWNMIQATHAAISRTQKRTR